MHPSEHDDPVANPRWLAPGGPVGGRRLTGGGLGARGGCESRADRRADPRLLGGRADDVGEHDAGLDRGELSRIANEDQAGVASHGLDEPCHQRQRDHRGLVDDHHVVREAVVAVVSEPGVAPGPGPEQAVQGRGGQTQQQLSDRLGDREPHRLLVDGLLQPRRRLARRRGERDQRRTRSLRRGLLGVQRDDPRDRGRLAGPGAAGDDCEAPQDRDRRSHPLALVARIAAEHARQPVSEHVEPDRMAARRPTAGEGRAATRSSSCQ